MDSIGKIWRSDYLSLGEDKPSKRILYTFVLVIITIILWSFYAITFLIDDNYHTRFSSDITILKLPLGLFTQDFDKHGNRWFNCLLGAGTLISGAIGIILGNIAIRTFLHGSVETVFGILEGKLAFVTSAFVSFISSTTFVTAIIEGIFNPIQSNKIKYKGSYDSNGLYYIPGINAKWNNTIVDWYTSEIYNKELHKKLETSGITNISYSEHRHWYENMTDYESADALKFLSVTYNYNNEVIYGLHLSGNVTEYLIAVAHLL